MARANRSRAVVVVPLLVATALFFAWKTWREIADDEPVPPQRAVPSLPGTMPEDARPRAPRVRGDAAPAGAQGNSAPPAPRPAAGAAEEKHQLSVTVLRSDGTPAAGAEVQLLDPGSDGNASATGRADAKGVAALEAPQGLARIVAWLGAEAAATDELVDPAQRKSATVRLAPALTVHGRVVLDDRPVEGAVVTVTVEPWSTSEFGLVLATRSGAGGRFETPPVSRLGIDPKSPPRIRARTSDLAAGEVVTDLARLRLGQDVVVRLQPGFTVHARVVDAEGGPIADSRIDARSPRSHLSSVATRADGRCVLPLPGGETLRLVLLRTTNDTVVVRYDDAEPLVEHWRVARPLGEFDPAKGDADLGDVVVARGLPVRGVVVDGGGVPARHAVVSLSIDGIEVGDVATRDDGGFVLPEVGPEPHRVAVREAVPAGSAATARTAIVDGVKGGDPDLRIVLPDALAIVLRFLSADDRKPLACAQYSVSVKLHGEGFEWYGCDNAGDAEETATFDVLSAGCYDVKIGVAGYEPLRFESVEVAAGRPATLDLLLRRKHE